MNVLIIEDELPAFKRLSKLVNELNKGIEILGHADSIETAIHLLNTYPNADLALMDIELADGQSFEIFKKIQLQMPVIFTTAYDEYALKAFKVNSIDYLLKPIDPEELKVAFEKLEKLKAQPQLNLNQLLASINSSNGTAFKKRFLVKLGQKLISIATEDIAYFHASEKVVYLIANDQKKYIIDHTLDELENLLNPNDFFRLNRQYLAKLPSIDSISTYFNGKLKIQLKPAVAEEVLISREKASEFKNWLNQ
jgi:DNA-binding LytR/AlgR family response regulator